METRIGNMLAGLVLGGSYAVGGMAVVRAALYVVTYLAARSDSIESHLSGSAVARALRNKASRGPILVR
jgi:hypothetical protein